MSLSEIKEQINSELQHWVNDKGLSVVSGSTDVGDVTLIEDKIAIIVFPESNGSKQLLDLKEHFASTNVDLFYLYPWDKDSCDKLFAHFESKLGLDTKKFAAKRLNIGLIDNKVADKFMREYHIQGSARGTGKISIALSDPVTDEIYAVQQFAKYRFSGIRGKGAILNSPVWEGLRLVFKPGVQIYGGASRLQKFFEVNYSPERIISYIDYAHSNGGYKAKQGFSLLDADRNQDAYRWVLSGEPNSVVIVDKNSERREPLQELLSKRPWINPSEVSGPFGKGVGNLLFGGKLGSRAELRAHPENGERVHNDAILEAIGYRKVFIPGQRKWEKVFGN